VPVLADATPTDPVLAEMVQVVGGLDVAEAAICPRPGEALSSLQEYYRRVAERRGWSAESPRDTLLLLMEEFGELAREVRRQTGLRRDGGFADTSLAHEMADVQLYLVHLANSLGIDLASAVTSKDAVNAERIASGARVA